MKTNHPELVELIRRHGLRRMMEAMRDYCYAESVYSHNDGYTGLGYLDLYDVLEEHMPPANEEVLCGEPRDPDPTPAQVFARTLTPWR